MNNYTIVISTEQSGVTPVQVKAAVEELLLRAMPPVTLRFGAADQVDDRTIRVALASDGRRDFIARALGGLEQRLPARVERVEWGDEVGGGAGVDRVLKTVRADPYANAVPQSEPARTYQPGAWSNLRGVLATLFLLIWIIAIVIYLIFPLSGKLPLHANDAILLALQLWLLISLFSGPPYAPWQMISRLTCDAEGIEVKYVFSGRAKRRAWAEIYGMKVNDLELALLSAQGTIRFSAKQRAGFAEEPVLIKTIIERARLRFVGTTFPYSTYKRADAPDA